MQHRNSVCHTATCCITKVTTASAQVGKWASELPCRRRRLAQAFLEIEDTEFRSFPGQQEAQEGQTKNGPSRRTRSLQKRRAAAGSRELKVRTGRRGRTSWYRILVWVFRVTPLKFPAELGGRSPNRDFRGLKEVDSASQLRRQSLAI